MTGKVPKKNPREGIDEYGRTKLHYAGTPEEIENMVNDGLDINLQDDNGWCPIHFYAQENNAEAINKALNLGANPNLVDSHGNSPLWTATMNARGEFTCVIALLKSGANPIIKNKHGRSPLDMANTIQGGLETIFAQHQNA